MNNPLKRGLGVSLLAALVLATAPSAFAGVHINIQPPELRIETHRERPGYVWQQGYWRWHRNQHVWTSGHYARQKHGRRWTDGRWDHTDRGYVWIGGRWDR